MDLIRVLVALHPKDWRERYGDEFAALLEDTRLTDTGLTDTGLTPLAVGNVIVQAAGLRLRAHPGPLLLVTAILISVTCEVVAQRTGLAQNVLWLPTDPLRALALLGAVGPWAALIIRTAARRRTARHG
jgi:hypothetical protein